MKKLKYLLVIAITFILLPLGVQAEGKINVYLFRQDGCGYCKQALAFFNGLDDEYKGYFNLVEKEISGSKDNQNLMSEVSQLLNADVKGVPFIVIGEKYFKGYTSAWDENIKETIKEAYINADGSYKDVVAPFLKSDDKDDNGTAITVIVLLVAVSGIAFLVYMAKENNDTNDTAEEKAVEEKITSKPVKEEIKPTSTPVKKKSATTAKKSNNATNKKSTTTKKSNSTAKKKNTKKK